MTCAHRCVDEEALFLASDFPIKPEDLIARAKEVLTAGIGTKDEGACLAEGFEFCAPVVGPLPKEEYLKALAGFKLEDSFDLNAQYHLFRAVWKSKFYGAFVLHAIDATPEHPTLWLISTQVPRRPDADEPRVVPHAHARQARRRLEGLRQGHEQGDYQPAAVHAHGLHGGRPGEGVRLLHGARAASEGRDAVVESRRWPRVAREEAARYGRWHQWRRLLTSRHPQVDRRQGNTGGLGGAFAFFYGVGRPLPIPECQPYKPSKRYRLLQLIGKLQSKFSKKDE